ncbi:MAG: type IV pilus modification protein PilV [Steroidobacterales bacterium]
MDRRTLSRSAGFTLVEVLVAVVIIAIGLLGIAKMESVALGSTGVAQQRSIAALAASSLAAAMHDNRGFWGTGLAPATITISGTTITQSTGSALSTAVNCVFGASGTSAPCTPTQVAAFDLQQWANDLNGTPTYSNPSGPSGTPSPISLSPALPFQVTTITCTQNVNLPVSCTIRMTWGENTVAVNAQGNNASAASAASGFNLPTYTLYVEP